MYNDIIVDNEGVPILEDNDLAPAAYAQHLYQKIYKAIMNMPPNVISGISYDHASELTGALRGYFTEYFISDTDIDSGNIEIDINTGEAGGESATLKMSYTTSAPDGSEVDIVEGLSYSLEGGVLTTIDMEPPWLESIQGYYEISILHNVSISEFTSSIIIPVRPVPASYSYGNRTSRDNIVLLKPSYPVGDTETTRGFSFYTMPSRHMYPISRYISGLSDKVDVITGVEIDNWDDISSNFTKIKENGEVSLIARKATAMQITGTATIVTAVQVTSIWGVMEPVATEIVYPLSPIRGKIVAIFPKSVSPGNYVIKYTGILEEEE